MGRKRSNQYTSTENTPYPQDLLSPNIINALLILAIVVPVFFTGIGNAHGATPGLSPGMWAHYSLSGNETGGAVDALFTVQRVDGDNVTFTDLDTYSDGHNSTDKVVVSISTGPTVPSSGEYFVISPQKPVGDLVYPGNAHYKSLPIQDITARPYVSASRQVAHVRGQNSTVASTTTTTTFEDFYWDEATGMFTEIVKSLNGVVVLHAVMSSTDLWQPQLPPDPLFIPTAVVSLFSASVVAVLLVGRYRRKLKRTL